MNSIISGYDWKKRQHYIIDSILTLFTAPLFCNSLYSTPTFSTLKYQYKKPITLEYARPIQNCTIFEIPPSWLVCREN